MKARLILLVLATSTLILVSFMIPLAMLIKTFAAQRAIDQAKLQNEFLSSLWATLDASSTRTEVMNLNASYKAKNADERTTIFLPDGSHFGAPPLPQSALQSQAVRYARKGGSFTEDVPGGDIVLRQVGGGTGGVVVIQTFLGDSALTYGVSGAWLKLSLVAFGLLALSVIVANELTRSLVRPLADVAEVADQLSQGDLSARADIDGPPEIRQVSKGLNRLAVRIGDLLAHERETLADLSHRLRTPLTALRIDAESLAADEETRSRVISDVDALTQTVNEIIAEARQPTGDSAGAISNATVIVRDRAAFWQPLAEDQERWMTVEIPGSHLLVRVPPEDLAACVDILLENVFAHTPEGSPFSVRLSARTGGGAWLVVSDSGPGFSHPDVTRRGESTRGSTGLGLDIARRVAETSGGTLTLGRSPHGGGAVTVGFGPVEQQSRPRRHVRHRRGAPPFQPARPPRVLRGRQQARAIHQGLPDPLRALLPGRGPDPVRPATDVPKWRSFAANGREHRYQADTDHMKVLGARPGQPYADDDDTRPGQRYADGLDARPDRSRPDGWSGQYPAGNEGGWSSLPRPGDRDGEAWPDAARWAGHDPVRAWTGGLGRESEPARNGQRPVSGRWPSPSGRETPGAWDGQDERTGEPARNGWEGLGDGTAHPEGYPPAREDRYR